TICPMWFTADFQATHISTVEHARDARIQPVQTRHVSWLHNGGAHLTQARCDPFAGIWRVSNVPRCTSSGRRKAGQNAQSTHQTWHTRDMGHLVVMPEETESLHFAYIRATPFQPHAPMCEPRLIPQGMRPEWKSKPDCE